MRTIERQLDLNIDANTLSSRPFSTPSLLEAAVFTVRSAAKFTVSVSSMRLAETPLSSVVGVNSHDKPTAGSYETSGTGRSVS